MTTHYQTSERLRQAATLLRERATAATPGPWEVSSSGSFICADHPQVAQSARVVAKADDDWIDHRSNVAFIATMAPPIALAFADWLDAEATHVRVHLLCGTPSALAAANAILGDAE